MPDFVKENSLNERELAKQAELERKAPEESEERKTLHDQLQESKGMYKGSRSD